jgi:hypothetical protein
LIATLRFGAAGIAQVSGVVRDDLQFHLRSGLFADFRVGVDMLNLEVSRVVKFFAITALK